MSTPERVEQYLLVRYVVLYSQGADEGFSGLVFERIASLQVAKRLRGVPRVFIGLFSCAEMRATAESGRGGRQIGDLSSQMVTGPSLTSATSIMAPKIPDGTGRPSRAESRSMNSS